MVKVALGVMLEEVARVWVMSSQMAAVSYLRWKAGRCEREGFGCVFLTTRYGPITDEELLYSSIGRTTLHLRVILQTALAHNVAAPICHHNHASGNAEPSPSDMSLVSGVAGWSLTMALACHERGR